MARSLCSLTHATHRSLCSLSKSNAYSVCMSTIRANTTYCHSLCITGHVHTTYVLQGSNTHAMSRFARQVMCVAWSRTCMHSSCSRMLSTVQSITFTMFTQYYSVHTTCVSQCHTVPRYVWYKVTCYAGSVWCMPTMWAPICIGCLYIGGCKSVFLKDESIYAVEHSAEAHKSLRFL